MAQAQLAPAPPDLPRKRWTRDEARRLADAGFLYPPHHYELIAGEIIEKVTQNRPHVTTVIKTSRELAGAFGPDFIQSQMPIDAGEYDGPEPDVAVLVRDAASFEGDDPGPEDIHLVVEASDSTLQTDLTVKALIYARVGIPEYWVVNINARTLHLFRRPGPVGYGSQEVLTSQESVSPLAAPGKSVTVASLLP